MAAGTCRKCGCTDNHACPGGCYWIEPDLCSRCAAPGFWMGETSGVLRPAVMAYLEHRPLTPEHIAALRGYLRQWIMAPAWDANPYAGVEASVWLAKLRARIDWLFTRETIERWLDDAIDLGLDPL